MKKIWEAPKLIVLVRSRPEENLTSSCKGGVNPEGPRATESECAFQADGCLSCQQWAMS